MIEITLYGASGGEVTGSMYLIKTENSQILVDAGMFQGSKEIEACNTIPEGIHPDDLDAILLTHGHLDHTGRIPLLIKYGYNQPIYATEETLELAQIILEDSAHLQISDAMRHNRKAWKKGLPLSEPLYATEHVHYMKQLTNKVNYNTPVKITNDISATWVEAGHMLGSGSILLTISSNNKTKRILFSGDLGPIKMPLLKPFETQSDADVVFLESTYGDRDHRPYDDTLKEFYHIVKTCVAEKGKILIPTFAIGRAQQLLYHLAEFFSEKSIKPFPVCLDSPMAIKATQVYRNHQEELDEEFHSLKRKGVFPLHSKFFQVSETAESSKSLNDWKGPCLILAGAGMCNGGRILHHLLHSIENPNTHIVIVGFQAYGSLGRRLVDGVDSITLFGEKRNVHATIHTLNGFSAHAGQTELMHWFAPLAKHKPKVYLTHGENQQRKTLAQLIYEKHHIRCMLPELGETIRID